MGGLFGLQSGDFRPDLVGVLLQFGEFFLLVGDLQLEALEVSLRVSLEKSVDEIDENREPEGPDVDAAKPVHAQHLAGLDDAHEAAEAQQPHEGDEREDDDDDVDPVLAAVIELVLRDAEEEAELDDEGEPDEPSDEVYGDGPSRGGRDVFLEVELGDENGNDGQGDDQHGHGEAEFDLALAFPADGEQADTRVPDEVVRPCGGEGHAHGGDQDDEQKTSETAEPAVGCLRDTDEAFEHHDCPKEHDRVWPKPGGVDQMSDKLVGGRAVRQYHRQRHKQGPRHVKHHFVADAGLLGLRWDRFF